MDGRDIGTAVLPNAEVKIFLVASVSERAERRFKENQEKGIPTDLETLTKEIQERDHYDSTRDVSPLKQAEDAVRIDTTGKSIPEVVAAIKAVVLKKVIFFFKLRKKMKNNCFFKENERNRFIFLNNQLN